MNKNTKTMLLTITAAVAALPLAGLALAQTAPKAAPAMTQPLAQTQTTKTVKTQEPMIKGSILLPAEQKGVEMTDAQESALYVKLAKITLDQAKAAALAAVPGTVTSIELDEEDGYLVYEVEIGHQEVIIDAGTGKVLYQGAMDAGDNDHDNGNDNEAGESGN